MKITHGISAQEAAGLKPIPAKIAAMIKQADTDILVEVQGGSAYGDVMAADLLMFWFAKFNIPEAEAKPLLARIMQKHRKVATLDGMEIDPELQGRGLGVQLLRDFSAEARKLGATLILTIADTAGKQKEGFDLLTWYRKHGFRDTGVGHLFPLLMAKIGNESKKASQQFPPFEQWIQHHPQFDIDPNEDDGEHATRNEIEERYEENTLWLADLSVPLEIYRALEIEDGQEPNFEGAGIHWTWVANSADAYFGGSSVWATGPKLNNPILVVIKALVSDPQDIDFDATLLNNMTNPEENEITLYAGAQLKLLNIDGSRYKLPKEPRIITATYVHVGGRYEDTERWELHTEVWRDAWQDKAQKVNTHNGVDIFYAPGPEEHGHLWAIVGDEVVGTAFFGPHTRGGDRIEGSIEVRPDWRRKGVGSALYAAAEKIADKKLSPSYPHSEDAEKFWHDNPKRIFGSVMATGGFPMRSFKKLWHVGTMNARNKRPGSYEGAGLSVSLHPEDWKNIADIGGQTWELTKPGNRFVNYHRLSKQQRAQVSKWGIEHGYAVRSSVFKVEFFDEEINEERHFLFTSLEEAEAEQQDWPDATLTPMPRGSVIGTKKLMQRTHNPQADDPIITPDLLAVVYVEDELGADGVWWSDTYDPAGLSAPRGVIFPSKLNSWKKRKVQKAAGEEIYYHGTNKQFDKFNVDKGGLGIHFGTKAQAQKFGQPHPYRLNISKPLELPDLIDWAPVVVAEHLLRAGVIDAQMKERVVKASPFPDLGGKGGTRLNKDAYTILRHAIKEAGYDSIVYENKHESAGKSVIVMDADKIVPVQPKGAAVKTVSMVYFHGSMKKFEPGDILTPQSDGYVNSPDPMVRQTERIIESQRPANALSRKDSVFMVGNPEEIDFAGGYEDYVYEVEPIGQVDKNDMSWYSDLGTYMWDREDDTEAIRLAQGYWSGKAKGGGEHTLFEYRASKARIVRVFSTTER